MSLRLHLETTLRSVIGPILICTRITTRIPHHQDRPKQTTRHASRSLSRAPFSRSRCHSSFRGHHRPKNSYTPSAILSTTQLFPRSFLPLRARHIQQSISLIFTFNSASRTLLIHRVNYTTRSSHVLNIATAPAPTWTVTYGSRNHF